MGTNPLIEGQLVRFCGNRKAAFIDADRRYTCFSKHGMLFSKTNLLVSGVFNPFRKPRSCSLSFPQERKKPFLIIFESS